MSNTNNLPVQFNTSTVLNLPADMSLAFGEMYDTAFGGFGGATRRIKVRKMDFALVDGGSEIVIPHDKLVGVFVGSAPHNHAVWYAKSFQPGQEPEQPDLVWNMPTQDTFPDALPEQFRKKIMKDGREVWAFQIRRRVAFALMKEQNGQFFVDYDNPYVLDMSGMSMYGKGYPDQNMYKWSGLKDVCSQHSTPGIRVTPSMFLMQIVIDPNVSVTGVVMFRPYRDPNTKQLQFLDTPLIQGAFDCACRTSTQDMLVVKEKLAIGNAQTQAPAPAPAPAQPVQQPVQQYTQQPVQQPQPAQQPVQQPQPVVTQPAPQYTQQPVASPTPQAMPSFAAPAQTPVQQMAAAPSTAVQAPQQLAPQTNANAGDLLAQAAAILDVTPAAQQPAQGVPAELMQPSQSVQMQAQAPVQQSLDPTTQASVESLLAQLG